MNSCFSEKNNLKIMAKGGIGIGVLLFSISASADQFDVVNYSTTAGLNYDDNVFRVPTGVDPLLVTGKPTKSDVIQTESIGINLDKKYANQEVTFKGTATYNKYNTFSNLDYTSTVYSAAWNGNLTSRLSAGIGDTRSQTLNTFTDIHVYTRNLTTADSPHVNADWWLASNWHLTFGASQTTTTASQSVINNQSSIAHEKDWGVKYAPADGSSIAFVSRVSQGESINTPLNYSLLVDTQNTEYQKEFDFNWVLSGKSVFSGNLINLDHQNQTFYQRDFSGIEGGLNYLYSFSDKSSLNISWSRSIGAWYDVSSTYSVTDTALFAPSWQISAKTMMHIAISRSKANYFGPIEPYQPARFDESQVQSVGIDWSPQRSVTLSTSFQSSLRYSNYQSYEYNDKSVSLSAQVSF